MARFNYLFCILGIFLCQVYMVKLQTFSCKEIEKLSGDISHSYTVRGASLYHRCWTLKNPNENILSIQLHNISLHNKPVSGGVLSIIFMSESKVMSVYNVSSQSQLRNFTTTSSVVEIHFKVNSAHFSNGMKTGFELHFNQDCNRILTDPIGNLSSPLYPDGSPTGAQCLYKIILRPGYLINITFHNVRIGYNEDCEDSNLLVRDGDKEDGPLIAEMCGSIVSYSIISTSNYLWVKFKGSRYFFAERFYANYSAVKSVHDDCNPEDSFSCSNNSCVSKSVVCDGIKDCENGADELGCHKEVVSQVTIAEKEKNPMVQMPTNNDGLEQVSEVITKDSEKDFQPPLTTDKLESSTKTQKLPPCSTGTTEMAAKKDVLKMEVKEHHYRLEVLELQKEVLDLQKRYEMDRIEFQKIFENEKLEKMRQFYDLKIRVDKRELDNKDSLGKE